MKEPKKLLFMKVWHPKRCKQSEYFKSNVLNFISHLAFLSGVLFCKVGLNLSASWREVILLYLEHISGRFNDYPDNALHFDTKVWVCAWIIYDSCFARMIFPPPSFSSCIFHLLFLSLSACLSFPGSSGEGSFLERDHTAAGHTSLDSLPLTAGLTELRWRE